MSKILCAMSSAIVIILLLGCTKPETWEVDQWYTQLSRYRDSEIRAFTIHLKVFEEDKIQKICDEYFNKYAEKNRYLRIDFFDDRNFVPDYSKGIVINEYQDKHRVAQYFYNPYTNQKRLEFFQ